MKTKPFHWPSGVKAALSITFDDARQSQLDIGLPILDACGIKGSFYVSIPQLLARPEDWRRVAVNGHEIGNHTLNHPCTGNFPWARDHALEDYTLEKMEHEIESASAVINEAIGVMARTFAYPCGQRFVGRGEEVRSYAPLIARKFVAGRGFGDEAYTDPGFCDLAQVCATSSDDISFALIEEKIHHALTHGQWLILVGHEVGKNGHQTTSATVLEALCQYAQDPGTGLWVDTVSSIASHVKEQRTVHV